ncbi:MAG: circularly permuted type 2 ATP-grasp protein, partial [Gammaproteobacteria bacterium TMED92]
VQWLQKQSPESMQLFRNAAELAIREMGISFTVYSDGANIDRAWPFDIVPRIIPARDWRKISSGLAQRTRALNCFIHDVYNRQRIFKDGIIPPELVLQSPNFREECLGAAPKHEAWAHICGTDLVRDENGEFRVLEDNLRVPSGVSYMIENRELTKRVLPELFENHSVLPVDDYPSQLYKTLCSIAPSDRKRPNIVVLTPGIFNSAYFEHAYLAQGMGVELVEGRDLEVRDNNKVYMHTIDGDVQVDVIYRRINEEFLDPESFRQDSMLGTPGLIRAWQSGTVAIGNAPGGGVADDKAIYAYVPEMIRYYLKQQPLVKNVPTFLCRNPRDRDYVLNNIHKLVVKPVNESGGYGVFVGPHSSKAEAKRVAALLESDPQNYVAQPTLSLSTAPTLTPVELNPRHLDLRPFILQGRDVWVSQGGLTRVALKEGSLVVNSSQGGGSKDTWVVETGG